MVKGKRIVITGAHSPLGSAALKALQKHTNCHVIALVTPWHSGFAFTQTEDRLTILEQDLRLPLTQTVVREISRADIVLHFAWFRHADVHKATTVNKLIIRQILVYLPSASRFVFISSVGASAGTRSVYGKAKWEVAQVIEGKGGLVLVCGLVASDPPFGPYAILMRWIQKSWIRPRFFAPHVPVYLTPMKRLTATILMLTKRSTKPGVYRIFDTPATNLNYILVKFEGNFKFLRPLFPIPTWILIKTVNLLQGLNFFPASLLDKLLTFLTKDRAYLDSLEAVLGED
ncbi:MAG: hypothetical protein CMF69_09850 [Magnetovibrio sp.]|nr:hypothetical protein [Magnetovibrio sp.]